MYSVEPRDIAQICRYYVVRCNIYRINVQLDSIDLKKNHLLLLRPLYSSSTSPPAPLPTPSSAPPPAPAPASVSAEL